MAGGGYPPPGGGQPPGYGPPPGYAPPPGYGPTPGFGPPGYGPPPGVAPVTSAAAPFGVDPITGLPFSDKQKVVAGLLQIFAGIFGAGRFYTGHTGIAIAQIVVCWVTCGIGSIWPTIDGVLMLMGRVPDAQGRPLRD